MPHNSVLRNIIIIKPTHFSPWVYLWVLHLHPSCELTPSVLGCCVRHRFALSTWTFSRLLLRVFFLLSYFSFARLVLFVLKIISSWFWHAPILRGQTHQPFWGGGSKGTLSGKWNAAAFSLKQAPGQTKAFHTSSNKGSVAGQLVGSKHKVTADACRKQKRLAWETARRPGNQRAAGFAQQTDFMGCSLTQAKEQGAPEKAITWRRVWL